MEEEGTTARDSPHDESTASESEHGHERRRTSSSVIAPACPTDAPYAASSSSGSAIERVDLTPPVSVSASYSGYGGFVPNTLPSRPQCAQRREPAGWSASTMAIFAYNGSNEPAHSTTAITSGGSASLMEGDIASMFDMPSSNAHSWWPAVDTSDSAAAAQPFVANAEALPTMRGWSDSSCIFEPTPPERAYSGATTTTSLTSSRFLTSEDHSSRLQLGRQSESERCDVLFAV